MKPRLISIALGALLAGTLTCPPAHAQSTKLDLSKLIQFASPHSVHRLAKPGRPGTPPDREMIGVVYVKQTYD